MTNTSKKMRNGDIIYNGAINVIKPQGMTSHDVVSVIRKIYSIKRVGHAGTLDPDATGVLPVFIGNSTRLIEYLSESDKTYRAQVTFGYETDTGDDSGLVINKVDCFTIPKRSIIEQTLSYFTGTIEQIPPMYSALKVNGKKLYELARAGITVDRPPRKITIHSINLLDITSTGISIEVTCSKGTYIRSLCQDIGRKLGILAVMSFLVRTRVGNFKLSEALTLEEIRNDKDRALFSADSFLDMPTVKLQNSEEVKFFTNGRRFALNYFTNIIETCSNDSNCEPFLTVKIFDNKENFIGIGRISKLSAEQSQPVLTPIKVIIPL